MIHFLATADHRYTITAFLENQGREIADLFAVDSYETLSATLAGDEWWETLDGSWWPYDLEMAEKEVLLPAGSYVFADIERLTPKLATRAAVVWNTLSRSPRHSRILNHPTRTMTRYELLRSLYEHGINRFNAYRLTEARWPERWPVLVRMASEHVGAFLFDPIASRQELQDAIEMILQHGRSRDDILIIEFCDYADDRGRYPKFEAYIIEDQIIPRRAAYSEHWMVASGTIFDDEVLRANEEYVNSNPHEERLREIFGLGRVTYGRVDYAVVGDEIQVFEINTNPMVRGAGPNNPVTRASELTDQRLVSAFRRFEQAGKPTQAG